MITVFDLWMENNQMHRETINIMLHIKFVVLLLKKKRKETQHINWCFNFESTH